MFNVPPLGGYAPVLRHSIMRHYVNWQVESLTAARKSAMQGQEPSDAIRVVNALLTQIDHIKR